MATLERQHSEIEEERLWQNGRERELWENLADLYAIFKATEALEKANTRGVVPASDYAPQCTQLIQNFQNVKRVLESGGTGHTVESFIQQYNMEKECPLAKHRLLDEPQPPSTSTAPGGGAAAAADAVHHFLIVLDQLRMELVAVDQIQPPLQLLHESLGKITSRVCVTDVTHRWLDKLSHMLAAEELAPEDVRQMLYELETAYSEFHKAL